MLLRPHKQARSTYPFLILQLLIVLQGLPHEASKMPLQSLQVALYHFHPWSLQSSILFDWKPDDPYSVALSLPLLGLCSLLLLAVAPVNLGLLYWFPSLPKALQVHCARILDRSCPICWPSLPLLWLLPLCLFHGAHDEFCSAFCTQVVLSFPSIQGCLLRRF